MAETTPSDMVEIDGFLYKRRLAEKRGLLSVEEAPPENKARTASSASGRAARSRAQAPAPEGSTPADPIITTGAPAAGGDGA